MKPLTNVEDFLKRFNDFKDGEFRKIEVISHDIMCITLAGQDEARAFDWISLKLEFTSVNDARLLEDNKLSLLDMSDGISIINNDNLFAFGLGECYNDSSIKSSICYIKCKSIKYEEALF